MIFRVKHTIKTWGSVVQWLRIIYAAQHELCVESTRLRGHVELFKSHTCESAYTMTLWRTWDLKDWSVMKEVEKNKKKK
jgi:hypothetical protein